MPRYDRNVSGFHRIALAKSKLEQAWRQRVLPQKGHGMPVNLFRPQNGSGRFHCTATRAAASSSNSPTKARTGAEMPGLSCNDEFGEPTPDHSLEGNWPDRKSTRLNSSHSQISYAVFC